MNAAHPSNLSSARVCGLPVAAGEAAQCRRGDTPGFEAGRLGAAEHMGSVRRDRAVIFFRRRVAPFGPAVQRMPGPDLDHDRSRHH